MLFRFGSNDIFDILKTTQIFGMLTPMGDGLKMSEVGIFEDADYHGHSDWRCETYGVLDEQVSGDG